MSDEALGGFISLVRQLAVQMAEESFRTITSSPGWTRAHLDAATETAIARMELAARDMLIAKRGNPDGRLWQAIWSAMEAGYRETMAGLLKATGQQGEATLQ